jgi:hypothetical protein
MKNLPSSLKVISAGHTDRQIADLISLLSFLESTLKRQDQSVKLQDMP